MLAQPGSRSGAHEHSQRRRCWRSQDREVARMNTAGDDAKRSFEVGVPPSRGAARGRVAHMSKAMNAPKLVIGANGFLGSHVTRQLVAAGDEVRVVVRPTANTRSIDDLEVTRFHGDVFDTATVRQAMDGCDDVYYCVVDTRAWLQDPAPLFRTNVEGLRNVLDVAIEKPIAASLRRFVFTSSYATVGRRHGRVATEDDLIDRRRLTPYVESRVQAEDTVLRYAADEALPADAMCVRSTDGSGAWGR